VLGLTLREQGRALDLRKIYEPNAIMAEFKHPKEKLLGVFDYSSCHGAYSDDALNAYKMNSKPGGKQPTMRDTKKVCHIWCLQLACQKVYYRS